MIRLRPIPLPSPNWERVSLKPLKKGITEMNINEGDIPAQIKTGDIVGFRDGKIIRQYRINTVGATGITCVVMGSRKPITITYFRLYFMLQSGTHIYRKI